MFTTLANKGTFFVLRLRGRWTNIQIIHLPSALRVLPAFETCICSGFEDPAWPTCLTEMIIFVWQARYEFYRQNARSYLVNTWLIALPLFQTPAITASNTTMNEKYQRRHHLQAVFLGIARHQSSNTSFSMIRPENVAFRQDCVVATVASAISDFCAR